MQARVWRLFERGQPLDPALARRRPPAVGELQLRLRLGGRGERWNVYLACLMHQDHEYVIPALDRARVVEISGRWLHLVGLETVPRSRSDKRPNPDCYAQAWWCRIEGATALRMRAAVANVPVASACGSDAPKNTKPAEMQRVRWSER